MSKFKHCILTDFFVESNQMRVFSDVACQEVPIDYSEWNSAHRGHQSLLEKYRGKKSWQLACMEDEIDDEGDRIYADLKNLEEEKQFYLY